MNGRLKTIILTLVVRLIIQQKQHFKIIILICFYYNILKNKNMILNYFFGRKLKHLKTEYNKFIIYICILKIYNI